MARNDNDDDKKPARSSKEVAPAATINGLPADDYKTAQETSGPDPQNEPVDPVPAEVLDIPKNQPYPTADTPPPPPEARRSK